MTDSPNLIHFFVASAFSAFMAWLSWANEHVTTLAGWASFISAVITISLGVRAWIRGMR